MGSTGTAQGSRGGAVQTTQQDKDWMKFGSAPMERPTTASGNSSQKVRELQEELKFEKKDKKKLMDEIENLNRELQK